MSETCVALWLVTVLLKYCRRDTSASPNLKKATLPSRPAFGRVQDPLPMQPTKHLPTYQPNPVRVKMEPDDSVIDLTTPPLVRPLLLPCHPPNDFRLHTHSSVL